MSDCTLDRGILTLLGNKCAVSYIWGVLLRNAWNGMFKLWESNVTVTWSPNDNEDIPLQYGNSRVRHKK